MMSSTLCFWTAKFLILDCTNWLDCMLHACTLCYASKFMHINANSMFCIESTTLKQLYTVNCQLICRLLDYFRSRDQDGRIYFVTEEI